MGIPLKISFIIYGAKAKRWWIFITLRWGHSPLVRTSVYRNFVLNFILDIPFRHLQGRHCINRHSPHILCLQTNNMFRQQGPIIG